MTQRSDLGTKTDSLDFEYELDAPLAKVWRALTVPEFIERWLLPVEAQTETEADARPAPSPRISLRMLDAEDQKFVRYSWREHGAPLFDSTVTFEVSPNTSGGTTFRILHEIAAIFPNAANANIPNDRLVMLLAA
jgi:uncharacterized protein YndB with AHSA1/START domain